MAYTNETMPKYVQRIEIDEIRFRQLETEAKFWANKYNQVVDRMEITSQEAVLDVKLT